MDKNRNVYMRFATEGTSTYPHLRIDPQVLTDIANDSTWGNLWAPTTGSQPTDAEKAKILGNYIHEKHKEATINFFNAARQFFCLVNKVNIFVLLCSSVN